jgi:Fe2+ or Zn2+ uptake regulation protein
MTLAHRDPGSDAARLRQRGLRVTGPRLAILAMLAEIGGHRSADELVLALRRGGYHHARTTVYNALDDLARAGLVRAAPVDAGALRYESAGPAHYHFVCRNCGVIRNVPVEEDLMSRPLPSVEGGRIEELDVVYRGTCDVCAAEARAGATSGAAPVDNGGERRGEESPQGPAGEAVASMSTSASTDAGTARDRLVDLRHG